MSDMRNRDEVVANYDLSGAIESPEISIPFIEEGTKGVIENFDGTYYTVNFGGQKVKVQPDAIRLA